MICKSCLKKVEENDEKTKQRSNLNPEDNYYCPNCDVVLTDDEVASHAIIDCEGEIKFYSKPESKPVEKYSPWKEYINRQREREWDQEHPGMSKYNPYDQTGGR